MGNKKAKGKKVVKTVKINLIVILTGNLDDENNLDERTREKLDLALAAANLYHNLNKDYVYVFPGGGTRKDSGLRVCDVMISIVQQRDPHCKNIVVPESPKDLFTHQDFAAAIQKMGGKVVDKVIIP